MKWFGESWGAPVCKAVQRTETPVGVRCERCDKKIRERDQGVVTTNAIVWHLKCFLKCMQRP
jgi:hypothetical protein